MTSVLIVDDDVVARTALALLLSHRGMTTHAVGCGLEALDAMRAAPCDVVLLDLRLPDGDGTERIAPLRTLNPDVGIIIVTGHAALDSAVRALDEGADAYVTKPAGVNEVVARIEAVVERQRLLAAKAQVEVALRESEARLRALIANIADMIIVLDGDGTIQFLSGSVERLLGYNSVDYLGHQVMNYVHPDDVQEVKAALAACLHQPGDTQSFAARVPHRDGSWRDIEGTGLNRLDAPAVRGIVLNCRDVTERRRAERDLRHHVGLANLVAHVSSLFVSSPHTDVDAALGAALRAIGTFAGTDRSLLFQVDPTQVWMGATHEWCAPGVEPRSAMLRDLRCADFSWFMHHMRSGRTPYVPDIERMPPEAQDEQRTLRNLGVRAVMTVPLKYQGRLMGALTLHSSTPKTWSDTDTTALRTVGEILANALERRRTEEQLVQSAKMASLGLMAGGIAHELRNPLGVIYAAAQLLRDKPDDGLLHAEGVERILAASRRASQIIDGLLTFARPGDAGMRALDVRHALDDALELVAHRLASAGVRVVPAHARELPDVLGNAGMLAQVFANLALNACNAMPDGGTLGVTTGVAADGWVEVTLTDTGVGIAPGDLPRVFDPFFTTMPVGKGTGLGLTISYSIVERHGGKIALESQPGRGTRLTVRLPAANGRQGDGDGADSSSG